MGSCSTASARLQLLLTAAALLLAVASARRRPVWLREPVLVVSVTVVLTAVPYNGSTLAVAGRDNVVEEKRELAIVGGTGRLRRAAGHVVWRTARLESPVHWVLELDVHASVPAAGRRSAATAMDME
ncbi:unnamed protein product [Urochloa humidicola]